jgi:hypothetical protein
MYIMAVELVNINVTLIRHYFVSIGNLCWKQKPCFQYPPKNHFGPRKLG